MPIRTLRSVLALAVTLAACARGPKTSPVAVVESVYSSELTSPVMGLPTPVQALRLSPFIGDSLDRLLVRATAIRDSEVKANPQEKPSWADGNLFTSLFEGPTSFYALPPVGRSPVKVPIHFERRDNGAPVTWVDTALMGTRNGTWVVEDIIYGGTWAFAPKGTLRTQLQR